MRIIAMCVDRYPRVEGHSRLMIEFYPQVKLIHIGAVAASGMLFLARGLAASLGRRWAMAAPLRYLSYGIDTVLLIAALVLMTMLQQFPFVQSWLTVKVILLAVYIGLGTYALKRGRTLTIRRACYVSALCVYLYIISIAATHSPYGILGLFRGLV